MATYIQSAAARLVFTPTALRVKVGAATAGIRFGATCRASPIRHASAQIVFTATCAVGTTDTGTDHGTGGTATALARTTALAVAANVLFTAQCGASRWPQACRFGTAQTQIVFGAACTGTTTPALFQVAARVGIVFAATCRSRVGIAAQPGDLNTVLGSGYSNRYPFNYTTVPYGIVLLTNGVDPMLRWDPATGVLEVAGVNAPKTAPSLQVLGPPSTTPDAIYAFVRYIDDNGNVSDLSPLSDPAPQAVNPVTGTVYTKIPVPGARYPDVPNPGDVYTDPYFYKVVRRQILRNTPGQGTTWYVDIDTTDMTTTSFVSDTDDATLQTQEAVPILNPDGSRLANIHGFPPSTKLACVMTQGRAFLTGEVNYTEGSLVLTNGSPTVVGVGTHWPATFAGRFLYITSPPNEFEIKSVDVAAQTLTLVMAYSGPSDNFATYGIRSGRDQWRLVYYSAPLAPESWPVTAALSIQDDGDEITGLMQLSSFLYILERRHIYRLTFQNDPAVDGGIFLSSNRGCLTQRLWVLAEDTVYMLDEMGIHSFQGGNSTPISEPIQDLFRDNTDSPLRVNWDADNTLWHASYSEVHGTVRFFVSMTGSPQPRHAICYNYRENRWWLEEYNRPILSSTRALMGVVRTFGGTDANQIYALDSGYYDGTRGVQETLFNPCTGVSPCGLDDAAAQWRQDLVGLYVTMYTGAAKGQSRRIVAVDAPGTSLILKTPWTIQPQVGDDYMIGAINWKWRGGWFVFLDDVEAQTARDVEVVFTPLTHGIANLQLYYNYIETPRIWTTARDGTATVIPNTPDVEVDLTSLNASAFFRAEGHLERYAMGDAYVSLQLGGLQHGEKLMIHRVTMNGVEQET